MTLQPQMLRIVVASPGDVQAERDTLARVIEELNRGIAAMAGLRFELSRWETDAYPGFHAEGPQGLIDPILRIADCDLLIGIFWKRFGTPTPDGTTGTEHEFRLAYEAWKQKQRPQIMVYFNQKAYAPQSPEEANQWVQVLEFRRAFPKEGLWWPYIGRTQFERLVRNHLTNFTLSRSQSRDRAAKNLREILRERLQAEVSRIRALLDFKTRQNEAEVAAKQFRDDYPTDDAVRAQVESEVVLLTQFALSTDALLVLGGEPAFYSSDAADFRHDLVMINVIAFTAEILKREQHVREMTEFELQLTKRVKPE